MGKLEDDAVMLGRWRLSLYPSADMHTICECPFCGHDSYHEWMHSNDFSWEVLGSHYRNCHGEDEIKRELARMVMESL